MRTHLPSVSLFPKPFILLNLFSSTRKVLVFRHFTGKELMTSSWFSTWDKTEASRYLFGPSCCRRPLDISPNIWWRERRGRCIVCVVVRGGGGGGLARHSLSSFSLSLYQDFLSTPCHVPPLLAILSALRAKVGLQLSPLPAACQERKSQPSEGPDTGELDSTVGSRVRMQEQ